MITLLYLEYAWKKGREKITIRVESHINIFLHVIGAERMGPILYNYESMVSDQSTPNCIQNGTRINPSIHSKTSRQGNSIGKISFQWSSQC